jgi:hypothetical protein
MNRRTPTRAPDDCATSWCPEPASVTLVAAHPTALACTTQRCRDCATHLAGRYLHHGYAIHLIPAASDRRAS